MNMMRANAAWLGDQLKQYTSEMVDIRQGSVVLTGIRATLVRNSKDVIDRFGHSTSVASYDWTLLSDDLVDGHGNQVTLRKGAIIAYTPGDTEERFEVMPTDGSEAVEDLDANGVLLVVHTKKVA